MELEQIYRTYFKPIYHYVWQLSGNEHIAEEITSETFFKAINSIESFRGDCDMRVWLCQIAKNTYYSYLKKNKRVSSIDEPDLQNIAAADELVDTQLGEQEEARQIRKILHDISEPYKEVFMWCACALSAACFHLTRPALRLYLTALRAIRYNTNIRRYRSDMQRA